MTVEFIVPDVMNEQNLNNSVNTEAHEFWLEADTLGRALLDCLDYFQALGLDQLPARLAPLPAAVGRATTVRPAEGPKARPAPPAQPSRRVRTEPSDNRARSSVQDEAKGNPGLWAPTAAGPADLERLIGQCQACPLGRTRPEDPAPGRGSTKPLLMVVGPTPAIYQGSQGDLLTAMVEKGLKLSPVDYYVTSLVKCRPPDESADLDQADGVCRPFLMRQLELLSPQIVLALGKKPGQRLSGLEGEPLGLLRPRSHKIAGLDQIWLRITYGLEDILASQKLKEATWQDLLRMRPGLQKLKMSAPPAEGRP